MTLGSGGSWLPPQSGSREQAGSGALATASTLSLARSLFKGYPHLGTVYSNTWVCGGHFPFKHNSYFLFSLIAFRSFSLVFRILTTRVLMTIQSYVYCLEFMDLHDSESLCFSFYSGNNSMNYYFKYYFLPLSPYSHFRIPNDCMLNVLKLSSVYLNLTFNNCSLTVYLQGLYPGILWILQIYQTLLLAATSILIYSISVWTIFNIIMVG